MAEALVEALSGNEIIEDFLDQIRRKLKYSCDLRDSDSYGQGYSGTATISLKLYGMDVISIEEKVQIQPKVDPPAQTETLIVTPVEVSETVVVEQEENLEAVRERSKQPETPAPPSEAEEQRMPERLKRRYTRRTPILEQAAHGGAVDVE